MYQNHFYKRYPEGDNIYVNTNPFPEELPYKYCWKYQDLYIVTDSIVPNPGDVMRVMDSVDGTNGAEIDVLQGVNRGKGVIYYMKDDYNNEVPYDFKNIQFYKNSVWIYTFGGAIDNSLTGGCHHNIIKDYILSSILRLNSNTFGNGCYSNTFDNDCYSNTLGVDCRYNRFGFGCYSNTFGGSCYNNTFSQYCKQNTFGDLCQNNTFGNNCGSNTFGNSYSYNTFGDVCQNNTFGNNCSSNTFGNYCNYNTFGNSYSYNTFGNYCQFNNFYDGTTGTTKKDYIRYIVLEDGCRYNNFYSNVITNGTSYLQRIRIKGLENTTATTTQITLSETNTKYEWVVAKNSSEVVKQYCPEDRLTNTNKLENKEVSNWVASTKYTDFGFQAQIDIADLTEADFVNVVFGVNEAVSGNYASAIEQYEGYILVFSKVDTTIIIPTIVITKIY